MVGGPRLALTLLFESGLGLGLLGHSWERRLSDHDLSWGGLVRLGTAVLLLAPWLAGRLHALQR